MDSVLLVIIRDKFHCFYIKPKLKAIKKPRESANTIDSGYTDGTTLLQHGLSRGF
jgi:hypothetical protein